MFLDSVKLVRRGDEYGKRIVVITSDYLYTFVSEAYKEINLDCEVEIVKYDNFKNIANIYNHYKDSALGFIVSGQMAHAAILKAIPDCKNQLHIFRLTMYVYIV